MVTWAIIIPCILWYPSPYLLSPSERSSFIYDFLMGTPCEQCSLQSSALTCLRHLSLVYLGFIYHSVSSPTSPPTRFCQLYLLMCPQNTAWKVTDAQWIFWPKWIKEQRGSIWIPFLSTSLVLMKGNAESPKWSKIRVLGRETIRLHCPLMIDLGKSSNWASG